ncbi:hypothetical protein F4781DRAFT_428820 [Annulohypoxylon bovei var. microspora]|nr:hypothetical protein F4781DRAFT_428820 [Annulohypoxylon bovei var. microspora]
MPPEGRQTKSCPTCGGVFTLRSLREHVQSSHLGTFCFFPGCDIKLDKEDDLKMTEALLHANEQQGGGPNRDGTEFLCSWPGCKQGQLHPYDRLASLKRHLRTKQKEELHKSVTEVAVGRSSVAPPQINYQVLQAWNDVHIKISYLEAKFQCLGLLVTPLEPPEEVGYVRRQMIIDAVTEADNFLQESIQRVESMTNSPKVAASWDQFTQTRELWHNQLTAWAYSSNPNLDHAWEWTCLNNVLGQLGQILNEIQTSS